MRREIEWQPLPAELKALAESDYADSRLWKRQGGADFRATVGDILRQHETTEQVSDGQIRALENILRFNDKKRRMLPPLEVLKGAEPVEPTDAESVRLSYDPLSNAVEVAAGWGFKSGSVITRLIRQFSDFPQPVRTGRVSQWRYSEVAAWAALHDTDLRQGLVRSHKKPKVDELKALRDRITELEAKLRQKGTA